MYRFIQEFLFSFRSLRRSPGFTVAAVLTLALGIAATAVVFSVISAVLLRPLPYPGPHELVTLRWQDQSDVSASAFALVKNRAHSFSLVTAMYPVNAGVNISAAGPPLYVKALPVAKDYFQTLGVLPEIGTPFLTEHDQPNAPKTAVLSHGLWTQGFSRDRSALGRDIMVNGERYKIIGITPRRFRSYPDADIWLPLQLEAGNNETGNNYRVIGRLAPGVSQQHAQYELDVLAKEYHAIHPWSAPQGTILAQDLHSFLIGKERGELALLFTAVAFVFIIACTNVAILILVRTTGRSQPIAIRAALGSTRRRLMSVLLAESLLLSAMGGLLGLILAKESLPLIHFLWPADLVLGAKLSIDWRVVVLTLAVSFISSLIFGFGPALKLSRVNLSHILAQASRVASASAEQMRTVRLLVFGQIVLTVMLLSGTMLLVKSLLNLYSESLGFDPEHVLVAQIALASQQYSTTASTNHLLDEVVKSLGVLSGVEAAAAVNGLPLEGGLNLPLHPVDAPGSESREDEYRPVTTGYFRTLGISLKSGRFFLPSDAAGSTPVAIINEAMARRWWPNTTAIGHYIRVDERLGPQPPDLARQIVGIVSDTHEKGPGLPSVPTMFVPFSQTPDNVTAFFNKAFLTSIIIRTSHRIDLSNKIRDAIQSVNPDLPLASFRPFSDVVNQSLARPRFLALLTAAFGSLALLLTVVGIQGLLNYEANLRTREMAIRMAVGASRQEIIRMIVQQGTRMVCLAVFVGVGGAFVIKRLLGSLLYNLQSSSLAVIVATGFLLASVATLISLLTAIRAAYIEPVAVLRNE